MENPAVSDGVSLRLCGAVEEFFHDDSVHPMTIELSHLFVDSHRGEAVPFI
jgi:hypothetical protein